jgi:hypothetical protein
MKLLFHSNHTPLLVFNKGIEACNPLQNKFCFLDCSIATSTTPSEDTKLFMNEYLVHDNVFSIVFQIFKKKKKKKQNLMLLKKSYNRTRLKKTTTMVSKRWWGWLEVHTTDLKTVRPCWRCVACRAQCLTSNNVT